MDLFCGQEKFFDWAISYNASNPIFSNCFQQIVFDLPPCVFLWIFSSPYALYFSHGANIPISPFYKAKLFTTIFLWFLAWIEFGHSVYRWRLQLNTPIVDVVVPFVVGASMGLALFFLHFDRKKGVRSSSLLTMYWFLFLIHWAFKFKSKVDVMVDRFQTPLEQKDLIRCVTFFFSYIAVLTNFVLCCFSDPPPTLRTKHRIKEKGADIPPETSGKDKERPECPEDGATFLSKMTFWWFTSTVITGYKRPLVDEDLWKLSKANSSSNIVTLFMRHWKAEIQRFRRNSSHPMIKVEDVDLSQSKRRDEVVYEQTKPSKKASLFRSMCKTFGPYFLLSTFLKILQDLLAFVSPQILSGLILFTSSNSPLWHGYFLALALFATAMVQSLLLQQYFHICFVVGMRLRSAIIAAIYRKSLTLSNSSRKQSTVGEVVNLMSVDAQRFMDLMSYLNIVWSGPFQIILSLYFLWNVLGPSILAGFAVMLLLVPVNAFLASKARDLQVKQMKLKDERIKLMNEILNGIKVLKMYAWEMSFKTKVSEIRKDELAQLRKAAYLNAATSFTFLCAPFLVSCTTFAVYVLSDDKNVLDARKAFVSLSLFNLLRFPLAMLPMVVTSLVQASVSLRRLESFLNSNELNKRNVIHSKTDCGSSSEDAITVTCGTFKWDSEEEIILSNIMMTVKKGSLVAIVGQVGCGKSSLVSALLGDMEKVGGHVVVKGSIAYISQQPWIRNLTVRENITFGKDMNDDKYKAIINACELKADFEMLPAGDSTEIGERGINLSGGQKQRVSIARAVYQDAQVYLFDDPLSAVDSHVGKNIFDHVLGPDGCLKEKTRVLVTHGLTFLPQVDKIFVMNKGEITEEGNYNELLAMNGVFAEFLRNYSVTEETSKLLEDRAMVMVASNVFQRDDEPIDPELDMDGNVIDNTKRDLIRQQSRVSAALGMQGSFCKLIPLKTKSEADGIQNVENAKQESKLTQEEKPETGSVRLSIIISYMRSVGFFLSFIIILCYFLQNAAQIYSSIWLAEWSTDPLNPDGTQNKTELRLGIYGLLGTVQSAFSFLETIALSLGGLAAAELLHRLLLHNILRVPMSFHDQTPTGRILNRFSKDVDVVDDLLIRTFSMFLNCFFRVLGTLFIICFATPLFLIALAPTMLLYVSVQRVYVRTSRQLKRLESISRSPIYSHFGETITGASTIRAYGLQESYIKMNEMKVDTNQMSYYPNIVSNRWLALRLEFVGNLIVLFAAIFAVAGKGNLSAGIVGLSISYALQITQVLNWMVRQSSELETNIVAVERVGEYSDVTQEAVLVVDDQRPTDNWPDMGRVKFDNYSTRYRTELDLVVKEITADIKGGEKIGIVGRTGAGKSSMTLALFRIIEPVTGSIFIDGRDISKMGLQDLRSKLSIIPQDPVLFSGSLRMNLDPFNTYSDEELWNALKHSHLAAFVNSLPAKLEHDITEGGENLSVGQRQLVCLARALLRKSKILVLDEATAAIDLETDDLIQATIRTEFADCTTFTIAHRLHTILDSTRVMVLDAGRIAEFECPTELLKKKGIFYGMAKDAGIIGN